MLFIPLSQTVTPARTPSPLERDVLYERPPWMNKCCLYSILNNVGIVLLFDIKFAFEWHLLVIVYVFALLETV